AHAPVALVERWATETDLVHGEPDEMRVEQYVGNRSFWLTLVAVAVELTRLNVPTPAPNAWSTALAELATDRMRLGNADASVVLSLFVEKSWEAMAERQLEFFHALRGSERTLGQLVHLVPRTCNADVLSLATYWSEQLSLVGADPIDTHHRLIYS